MLFWCSAEIEGSVSKGSYIHCYAHKHNLALADCVEIAQFVCDFFCLLESLYVCISTSKAHAVFVTTQKELYPVHQLQKLSDTRWAVGLLLQIKSFKFLLLLIIFNRVLTFWKSLSDYQQQHI